MGGGHIDTWTEFGPQAYFLNVPSKFIHDGGTKFWLISSANYTNNSVRIKPTDYTPYPEGVGYGLSLHEVAWKK